MRAYLRVDPEMAERKNKYPDGAFAAFVSMLCAAEQQPHRGRFKTVKILKAYLGARARWIKFLIDHKDLIELENGVLYVDGWDEWQEGDWKVGERVQRIRNRPRVTVPVTPSVTPSVTVDVTPPRRPLQQALLPPLTLPDSPSERIADSYKPLATSRGDMEKEGLNGSHQPPPLTRLPTDLNTWTDWLQLSEKAQVGRVMDFLPAKQGNHQLKPETYQHELAVAKQIISLALDGPDLKHHLEAWWDDSDPDDRPSSLEYFWTRLQQLESEGLKQQSRPHARISGPTKLSESLPDIHHLKGARQ